MKNHDISTYIPLGFSFENCVSQNRCIFCWFFAKSTKFDEKRANPDKAIVLTKLLNNDPLHENR